MSNQNFPKTLALIPDGNRRWARKHRLSMLKGYDLGIKKFILFSEWCMQYGIDNIAVWAFSTENFMRNEKETKTLFGLYKKVANDKPIIARLHSNKTRFRVIGNKELLPPDLRRSLERLEKETMRYKGRIINMLIGYGGKNDILHAVKAIAKNVKDAASINEAVISKYLISNSIPNIDLVIRTSGEQRLSGFMPWQTEYSELYFSKKLWPSFTKKDLKAALTDYSNRQRRFGK